MIQDGGKIMLPPRRGDRQPGHPTVFLGFGRPAAALATPPEDMLESSGRELEEAKAAEAV